MNSALSMTSEQGAGEGLKSAHLGPQGLGVASWRSGQGFAPTTSIRRLCHGTRHFPDKKLALPLRSLHPNFTTRHLLPPPLPLQEWEH